MPTAKPVKNLLSGSSGQLKKLQEHGFLLQKVGILLQRRLPSPLNTHCQVANLREGVLILFADSPAWLTQLRFYIPELLAYLRAQPGFEHLRSINLKVLPQSPQPAQDKPQPRIISRNTAELINSLADCTHDPELKKALMHLARRASDSA